MGRRNKPRHPMHAIAGMREDSKIHARERASEQRRMVQERTAVQGSERRAKKMVISLSVAYRSPTLPLGGMSCPPYAS